MTSTVSDRESSARNRSVFIPGVVALVVLLAVGAFWFARKDFSPLPLYGEIPPFSLVDENGETINRDSLMGKVSVLDLIYTRCTDTCPLQTATLVRIQKELKGAKDFHLVSISIDPENDKPEVLKKYAAAHGADRNRWFFLTGKLDDVESLVKKGLRLPFVQPDKLPVGWKTPASLLAEIFLPRPAYANHGSHENVNILHSSRFVLLDRKVQIRGYYHSDKIESVEKLKKDLRILLGL